MRITRFEDLEIWQESVSLAREIYALTNKPIFKRDFGLGSQVQRSVVSISANIVEGFESNNNNVFIRHLTIAKGSAGESRSHLYIAEAVGYITKNEQQATDQRLKDLARRIGAFIAYLSRRRLEKANHNKKTRNSQLVNSQT